MIKLNAAPPDRFSDSLSPELLDAASLETVLSLLDVIDAEDLALLETLTPVQKRQVWDATPPATRLRLKQLRSGSNDAPARLSPSVHRSHTTPLIEASDLLPVEVAAHEPPTETSQEETAAIDLESQREEIDLMLQEPLDLMAQPTVSLGDWVVLQAQPKLSKAEMLAIWEVIEMQGNYARIATKALGSRLYPMSQLVVYPKPLVSPKSGSSQPAPVQAAPDEFEAAEPEF